MPNRDELVAAGRRIPEIATEIGADSLIYQEVAAMQAAILEGSDVGSLEMSCFTGDYIAGHVTPEYLDWVQRTQGS
jgi:amidophosphoribosyltransferase